MSRRIILTVLMTAFVCLGASAQRWAAKTNLLYWAATTPNIGAEVALGKHSTLGATVNWNPWTIGSDNKIQHWFVRPEYRYWFSAPYTRFFLGLHAMGGGFEVGGFKLPLLGDKLLTGLPGNYYKGSFAAAGVSFGYAFYLSPRLNLELSAGLGVARIAYHTEPIRGPKPDTNLNRVRYLPMPTELGISLVYLFNAKK